MLLTFDTVSEKATTLNQRFFIVFLMPNDKCVDSPAWRIFGGSGDTATKAYLPRVCRLPLTFTELVSLNISNFDTST